MGRVVAGCECCLEMVYLQLALQGEEERGTSYQESWRADVDMADDLELCLHTLVRYSRPLQNCFHIVLDTAILPSKGGHQRSEKSSHKTITLN